jgi:hypothetical protein
MVNRIWQWHFGKGLVGTPNNFGKMGGKPTHPELLDWLADYFIEHGWSIKEMHRLIMRSAVYQQGAAASVALRTETPQVVSGAAGVNQNDPREVDPENKLLWQFPPRRLTAEELRDSMLFVSAQLSTNMGGPPVFPEINMEAAIQPRHIMGSIAPPYKPSLTREQRNRRTIYTVQIRSLMNPLLEVFNAPNTDNSCEQRDETTVATQVFALFNSQSAHDAALAMADRLQKTAQDPRRQIDEAFRLAYGRLPNTAEQKVCLAHLERMAEHHRKTAPGRFELPKKIVQNMIEELTGEPFEFEEDWDVTGYEYSVQPADVSAQTRALADLCLVILNSNEFVYVY